MRCLLGVILAVFVVGSAAAAGPEPGPNFDRSAYGIHLENDYFVGTDQNYTTGLRISMANPPLIDTVAGKISDWMGARFLQLDRQSERIKIGFEFAIGQSIFTPQDRMAAQPLPDQHPYAGYLYLELATFAHRAPKDFWGMKEAQIFDTLNLQLGVVGPASGAEWVQDHFHALIDDEKLEGWANQLHNEPALAVSLERKLFVSLFGEDPMGFGVDLVPSIGATIGNVLVQGSVGATLRAGWSLKSSYGPARIRPALGGASIYVTEHKVAGFVFASAGGRIVGRNIFLDGNTFRDSARVDKKLLVDDLQAGLVLQFEQFIMAFTLVSRGREFATQHDRQRFGAVSFVWRGKKR